MLEKNYKNFPTKFSNISVFERREKNISYVKNLKRYIPLKLYNNKKKSRIENEIKNKHSDINDILYSFYNYQTSESNKAQNSQFCDISNMTVTSLFNKTCNNLKNSSFPLYLTETEPSTFYSKTNSNNKKGILYKQHKLNEKLLNIKNEQNSSDKIGFLNNYKTFSKLSDYFEEKKKEEKPKREINKTFDLIDIKINKIKAATNDNFYNAKQYLAKTRKLILLKYDTSVKKELKLLIEEKKENARKIIENKIYSLNKIKKLHHQVFDEKLLEYVKYISLKKDEEEKYDLGLLNEIYSMKKEISLLTNRIKKVQIEKNSLIQWIMLLIKVKERKLHLPNYYSKLLEISIPKIDNQRRSAKPDTTKISKLRPKKTKSIKYSKEKIKSMANSPESILNNFSEKELIKILNYRQNLIFNSPEDFYDEIKSIENMNIKSFEKLDFLIYEIKRLKGKYNNLLNDKEFCNSSLIFQIKKYENELERNKQIYNERKKLISEYKGINNEKHKNKKNKKIGSDNSLESNDNEIILNQKKSKLFNYVEKLFSICKEIKIKKGYSNSDDKEILALKRANINQEEIILNMIKFSEIKISKLLHEFMMYNDPKNPNYDYIRKLRINYTKKRNIQKARLARIEKEKKNLKFVQEIGEKNDQILFLKKTKKDLQSHFARVNSQSTGKKRKKVKLFIPNIEDFLFDDILNSKLVSERNMKENK